MLSPISRDITYSLSNTKFAISHKQPGELLQDRVVSLLQIETFRVRLPGQPEFVAWILDIATLAYRQLCWFRCL